MVCGALKKYLVSFLFVVNEGVAMAFLAPLPQNLKLIGICPPRLFSMKRTNQLQPKTVACRDPAFRGQYFDRQWELTKENFRGKWCGPSYWYIRQGQDLDLSQPSWQTKDTCYEITFSDSETGQWKGTGLRFTNETLILPLSRSGFNPEQQTFLFPSTNGLGGIGGQTTRLLSRSEPRSRYAYEINFFNQRTRSMIIPIYTRRDWAGAPQVVLESVGIAAFRCQLGCAIGERPRIDGPAALAARLRGWQGQRLSFGPSTPLDETRRPCGPFDLAAFAPRPGAVTASFPDNIVLSAPEVVPDSEPFEIRAGCLQTDDLFKLVTVSFAAGGNLLAWTFDEFRPPNLAA